MNLSKIFFVLFVFVGLLLVSCSNEQQSPVSPTDQSFLDKVTIVNFTSLSYPTVLLDPGEQRISGGNFIGRNVIAAIRWDSENDSVNASGILTLNFNLDAVTGEGPYWGTLTLTPDEPAIGGEWDLTWNGRATQTGPTEWTIPLNMVGHGSGGSIDKMHLDVTNTIIYNEPFPSFWLGYIVGEMKSTGN